MAHATHHIIPRPLLLKVFLALVALTVITALTGQADLGVFNFLHVPLAIGIAVIKASLVVLFFMGLKYDRPVNALAFIIGLLMVGVFLAFTLLDMLYRGDIGNLDREPIRGPQMEQVETSAVGS
ncbi:cytochrome C oxidase subunit IV family protein [Rhodothermus profundi]|uniref:Cytochrome c oxidase subunit 4 n=1 Tax=Rhodothermus profundi TaxID=633813 RepID=A0A1M6TS61_9BACT|nr:cytochrome C oxidase subunit IV family protein [Rhodothermus profundi]SHK59658.1 cytochrome c oxidase subunit 4 [Rhodothermus profundi]